MNKPSHRIETDDSGGESHALYFAPWFKWGLPVIVLLSFVMALVSISFQQSRLAMTLLHQYLPEIATAVDVADASPGPTKIPAPGDIIQFLAIMEDGNLRILHGAKSEQMVAFTSLHELSYPRLNVKTVGAALNIVTDAITNSPFFLTCPFGKS
jgi:hypothetical protein